MSVILKIYNFLNSFAVKEFYATAVDCDDREL